MKGKADNIGSCVEKREHFDLSPDPMYVRNDVGHKLYKQMSGDYKTRRPKNMVLVDDLSNKTGMRAQGGF